MRRLSFHTTWCFCVIKPLAIRNSATEIFWMMALADRQWKGKLSRMRRRPYIQTGPLGSCWVSERHSVMSQWNSLQRSTWACFWSPCLFLRFRLVTVSVRISWPELEIDSLYVSAQSTLCVVSHVYSLQYECVLWLDPKRESKITCTCNVSGVPTNHFVWMFFF